MIRRAPLPLATALALALAACRAPLPAPSPESAPAGPTPTEIAPPPGVTLVAACTPTGPERCFDAVDDNCNGVIDEGCGLHTGAVQIAIAWPLGADVDLLVTDPAGELVRVGEGTTAGLRKDRDCGTRDDVCRGQNVENVWFAGDADPPPGRYKAVVHLEKAEPSRLPVPVRLGARIGTRVYGLSLELAAPGEEKVFAFVL